LKLSGGGGMNGGGVNKKEEKKVIQRHINYWFTKTLVAFWRIFWINVLNIHTKGTKFCMGTFKNSYLIVQLFDLVEITIFWKV
jgi:hypothetical protein